MNITIEPIGCWSKKEGENYTKSVTKILINLEQ